MNFCQLLVITLVGVLTIIQYSLAAPIIPLQLNHRDISQTTTGTVIASYSLGYIIGSILPTDCLYQSLGRRKVSIIAFIVLAVSLFLYAIGYFLSHRFRLFFVLACIVTRVMEGISTAVIITALISLLSIIYPDQRGKALSARACGSNLGTALGGVIGGTLFMLLGYFGVFLAFSLISLFSTLLLFIFKEAKTPARSSKDSTNLTLGQFLKARRPLLALLCNGMCDLLLFSLEPTLALKLSADYNFSAYLIGGYFFLFFVGGAITMTAMIFIPEHWDKRKLICPSMVLMAFFSFLVGPSSLFFLPNSYILIGIGMFLTGATRGICISLCPTDAIIGGIKAFPEHESKVSDLVSSIYSFLLGIAMLFYTILGSAIVQAVGFRWAFDIVSIVLVISSTIYTVSTIVDWRAERREIQSEQESRGEESYPLNTQNDPNYL